MKYYVIYTGKDVEYYKTTYFVVAFVDNEEVAKDICQKFGYQYALETVGDTRSTPRYVTSTEKKGETE